MIAINPWYPINVCISSTPAVEVAWQARSGGEKGAYPLSPPTISTGSMTAAGEGEGDGVRTPPRTPSQFTETISTQSARSDGLPPQGDGEPDLPAFLDRMSHG